MLLKKGIAVLLLEIGVSLTCVAQSYEEKIAQCTTDFRLGLDTIKDDELLEAEVVRRMNKISDCLYGFTLPAFNVTTMNGKRVSNEYLKGKVVLISFWFTGCAPCVEEVPMFNALQKDFSERDFYLLSFATLDDKERVIAFQKKRQINYDVVENSKLLLKETFKMGFIFYPTIMLLGKRGEIVYLSSGGPIDQPGIEKRKQELSRMISEELAK